LRVLSSRVAWIAVLSACGRIDFAARAGLDASTPGGDSGDAAPACAPAWELCDGFEGGAIDPMWRVGAGVTLDTSVAHRGSNSVHMRSAALGAGAMGYYTIDEQRTLPLADPTFYVRAWVRLGTRPAVPNAMELIAAQQTGGAAFGDFVFVQSASMTTYSQFNGQETATVTMPPTGTWFCLVWKVTRTTTTGGRLDLSSDALDTIALTNAPTDGTPPIDDLAFGIGFATANVIQAQPVVDVWFDDLIVDASPLTCAD
jgi:hypothetical protein